MTVIFSREWESFKGVEVDGLLSCVTFSAMFLLFRIRASASNLLLSFEMVGEIRRFVSAVKAFGTTVDSCVFVLHPSSATISLSVFVPNFSERAPNRIRSDQENVDCGSILHVSHSFSPHAKEWSCKAAR